MHHEESVTNEPVTSRQETSVVVTGGGPAGVMLGLLLARSGIDVTVLEKHADFFRDFRGDTVHASTVRLMDELGLGKAFRALPQGRLGNLELPAPDGGSVVFGDFSALPEPYNYVAMMPQWDLLNFLTDQARREPGFRMMMSAEVLGPVVERGRVVGVRYRDARGEVGELRAHLTVACDGRHSTLRTAMGLTPREYPIGFDTWWFRLPRHESERATEARLIPDFQPGEFTMTFVRPDYYQVAYFAEKGADSRLRAEGVEAFRERVARLRPQFADRVHAIRGMDDLHLLNVSLNRLRRWYTDGLLLIGDAAHAMSPVGGLGVNLAIQDAVATARLLAEPIRKHRVTPADLARVEKRRRFPTVVAQTAQRALHRSVFDRVLSGRAANVPRPMVFAARHVPGFTRLPARLTAFGIRPEHVPASLSRT